MNAIPKKLVTEEKDTEVVHETEDSLVEVGAVTETKGGFFGSNTDTGGTFRTG